ncbi:MAG: hypothetical protein AB7S87_15630, partial [Burkholderiales bacterium]
MTDENNNIEHDPNETPKAALAFSGWSKRLLVGGLALVAVAGTGVALAGGGWGHGRHGIGGFGESRFERMLDHV